MWNNLFINKLKAHDILIIHFKSKMILVNEFKYYIVPITNVLWVSNPMIATTYLSSRPGSARTWGVWMDSRKMAPPSPSIRNACAPIVTSFRFTENKFRPLVSLMRNPAARHSNLSCPKNKWFSSKPFGSRVFIEKLREDSL